MNTSFFTKLLIIFLLLTSHSLAEDLVSEVRKKNRQAIESIQTFHCSIESKMFGPDGNAMSQNYNSAEYWRSGHDRRWKGTMENRSRLVVVKEGIAKGLSQYRKNNQIETIGSIEADSGLVISLDPWHSAKFNFLGSVDRPGNYIFDEMLNLPDSSKVIASGQKTENNKLYYTITTMWKQNQTVFWFDPNVNCLITKMTSRIQGSQSDTSVAEISEFYEGANGIYFPQLVVIKWFDNGKLSSTEITNIKNIQINKPIKDDLFELKIPNGISVQDTIKGISYIWGKEESTVKKHTLGPPSSIKKELEIYPTTQMEDTNSWTDYLPPISFCAVVVCIILIIYRNKKLKSV